VDGHGFWIIPGLIDTHVRLRYREHPVDSDHDQEFGFLLGVTTTRLTETAGDVEENRQAAVGRDDPWLALPRLVVGTHGASEGFSSLTDGVGISALVAPPPSPTHGSADPGEPSADLSHHLVWADADPDSLRQIATSIADRGLWIEPLLAVERRYVRPYGVPVGLHRLLELPLVSKALEDEPVPEMSEDVRTTMREELDHMDDFVRAFNEAGGSLVTGSDEVIAPGLAIHAEIAALVGAGLSNTDALAAATRNAALAIGVQDSLGTLEPGKLADFIVLEGDPLADVANIQLIARVAKGGVLYDPSTLLDNLAEDLRDRATPPWLRLLVGFGAMVIVAILTLWAIRRQRAGLASSSRRDGILPIRRP